MNTNPTLQAPYSFEAESGLIGSLILSKGDSGVFADVVATTLEPDDFYLIGFREAYRAIIELAEGDGAVDPIIIKDALVRRGVIPDKLSLDNFARTIETVPTASNGAAYAKIVKEYSIRRKMNHIAYVIGKKNDSGQPLNGELDELAALSQSLSSAVPSWRKRFKTVGVFAEDLKDLVDKPIPYLVSPIIVRGALTQIQGAPKGGKSSFALYLASCMSHNIWPSPDFLSAERPLKVLYLAWEDPAIMMAKRLSLYHVGLGLDRKAFNRNIIFMFAPQIFVEQGDQAELLAAAIKELEVDVTIIDTLSHIHGVENENDNAGMKLPMAKLMQIATKTDTGIMYAHHTSKGSKDKDAGEKGRGASSIVAAWHILIDWGKRESGSNVNLIEVQTKFGHEWMYWDIAYNAEKDEHENVVAVSWDIKDHLKPDRKTKSMDQKKKKILETLDRLYVTTGKPVPAKSIMLDCGLVMDIKSMRRLLRGYVEDGIVIGGFAEDGMTAVFTPIRTLTPPPSP